MKNRVGISGLGYSNILQGTLRRCGQAVFRSFCSQFGIVHADNKVEAGEMDVEGRAARPLDQNNHFLLVQPNQRAYSWVVFPCALQGKE